MTKQTINVGSGELTGDGESIRSAFVKTNDNFNEVYTSIDTFNNAGYLTTATLADIGYLTTATLPAYPTIPNNVSAFYNDLQYLTTSTLPAYPTVPTNVGDFTNNVNYLTTSTLPPYPTVPTNVGDFANNVNYLTTATLPVVPTNMLTSGTNRLVLSSDGSVTFGVPDSIIPGAVLYQNTAAIVVNLVDMVLDSVPTYSTTSTDFIEVGTFGNESRVYPPYTVFRLTTTPPIALFNGDIIAGPSIPVGTAITYAGTGSFTTSVITDADYTLLVGGSLIVPPPPGVPITLARPIVQQSFSITTPANNSIGLVPGTGGTIIAHKDIIPYEVGLQSLGSALKRWKHLWMGAGTIYFEDEFLQADLAITARNGLLSILGGGGLDVGEFTLQDNQITIKSNVRDIIIGSSTATGYVQFNRPVRMTNSTGGTAFEVTRSGMVTIYPKQDISVAESALSIIGNAAGLQQPRTFTGTMLQITGQNSVSTRISIDSFGAGAYPNITGRAARGTVQEPTATKKNDILFRIATQGYGDNQYVPSIGRISIEAVEDFTNATAGTRINFQTATSGTAVIQTSTIIDSLGVNFLDNPTGGITFHNGSRQTQAFTGTVDVSLINNLNTVAVTEVIAGVGLSGGGLADSISLDNTGVLSIAGTANQISVNGATTSTNGSITLSLPQDLSPTSNVTFNDINISGQLNFLSTSTILIPNTIEGTILLLGSTATDASQLDGGGIKLGNTSTGETFILWNRAGNYWDFDGSGISTQQLIATYSTFTNINVIGGGKFGILSEDNTYAGAFIQVDNDLNGYGQILNVNHSAGTQASADFVAVNDIGNDGSYFIDMGINSSNYNTSTWKVNGANDGYLYVQDGNLAVGTTQDRIVFFTNGTLLSNIKATITDAGLRVVNTVTSAGFYGPLTGNVTGNVTGSVTGNAGSVTNGVYSNQTYTNPTWIGSLAGSKITGAVALATTVTNGVYTTDTGTVSNNMLAGGIANNKLSFNQITFNAGTGIGVSVASPSLGGSTTISNTGVTSITAGTGTHVSTSTDGVVVWVDLLSGPTGYTGSTGTQGVIGYTGSTGTQGVIGYTGSTGTQGVIGYTGSTGTQGVIGYTGSTGTQGVIGYTGSKGVADVYVSSISTGTGIFVTTSTGAVTVSLNTSTLMNQAVSLVGVTSVLQGILSVDFASVGKNAASSQTFTITGLTTNHHIIVQAAAAMTFGLFVTAAWASASNTVTIQVMNVTGGAIDNAAINFNYFAWV